ncbi:MAG: hypothetical protein J6C82_02015 [Clostridia bacterium]|nr:hypothetical protein [Clostridia bacterium]
MKRRKLLSAIIAGAMLLSSAGITAFATTAEVKTSAALIEAITAAKDGDVIKLTANITTGEAFTVNDGITIDLNKKTLTISKESSYLNNATIKNGRIELTTYTGDTVGDGIFHVKDGKTAKIDNVVIHSDEFMAHSVFHLEDSGNLEISNSVIGLANNDPIGTIFYSNTLTSKVTVTDSVIRGENVGDGAANGSFVMTDSSVYITGTVDGGMDHGFNGSSLVLNDTDVTLAGGNGRGITLGRSEASTIEVNGDSEINIDMAEGGIVFHSASGAASTLKIAETALVTANSYDTTNATAENITGKAVSVDENISILTALDGEGTEEQPYLINDIEEFIWFAEQVNGARNYKGEYIMLNADIDLNGAEWTPIGTASAPFEGTFDGSSKLICNLTINGSMDYDNGTGNSYVGLFGYANNSASIKNVTIENADVSGCLYVGPVVGRIYTGKTIDNCHVKGNISVDGYWYIGGVVGRNDYAKSINNCSVIGNDGSYIKADTTMNQDHDGSYVGGIVGFRGEGAMTITDCVVKNVDISGATRVGGISGIAHYGNTISGCTAENVTLQAEEGTSMVGLIAGVNQGTETQPAIITDYTLTNVTAKAGDTAVTNLFGSKIDGTAGVTNIVAQIGTKGYETLADALKDVTETSVTVEIYGATELAGNIPSNSTITFEGKTENASIDFCNTGHNDQTCTHPASGSNITFKNLKLIRENVNYCGLKNSASETLTNCTVEGVYWTYAPTVSITECTFNQDDVNSYNIWIYGGNSTVEIKDCEFNSNGRCVLVYNEGYGGSDVSVTGCTFTAETTVEGKAAIEIDSTYLGDEKFTIAIDDSTATGFGSGSVSGNSLWNNKYGEMAEVFVDDVQVLGIAAAEVNTKELTAEEAGQYYVEGTSQRADYFTINGLSAKTVRAIYTVDGKTSNVDFDVTGIEGDDVTFGILLYNITKDIPVPTVSIVE